MMVNILSASTDVKEVTNCRSPIHKGLSLMLLAIDAGNTRTKWAVLNAEGHYISSDASNNHDISANSFLNIPVTCKHAIVSNVAGASHADLLKRILQPHGLKIECLTATKYSCGVFNQYIEPESLGSDRWASLIAAWHIQKKACIVVNAGTAITIDTLIAKNNTTQAEFIGGMIMPGLALMQNCLGTATALLPKQLSTEGPTLGPNGFFAKSTAQAISAGTLCAACGAIERIALYMHKKTDVFPAIVISGGDAPILQKYLSDRLQNQVTLVDHLVLSGLNLIHRAQFQQSDKQ
jgi:type III pantothenate kinase